MATSTSASSAPAWRAPGAAYLIGVGRKVYAIVNYDNVYLAPQVMDAYAAAVMRLTDRYYKRVTRYTTSSIMRLKLDHVLESRDHAPHIYESRQKAAGSLRQ